MTTAARPTFDPARGGNQRGEKSLSALSKQYSSRDLPAHLTLKERKPGQGTQDEITAKDLKSQLEQRERIADLEKGRAKLPTYLPSLEYATQIRLAIKAEKLKEKEEQELESMRKLETDYETDDLNHKSPNQTDSPQNQAKDSTPPSPPSFTPPNLNAFAQLDADDDLGDGDFDEDDLDEDDPKELLAELNRIKQERAAEEEMRKAEEKIREEKIRMENILSGNPLLNHQQQQNDSFRIKRRWDDDVVFKNCARGEPDSKKKPYVNDTLRQEFHKRFMEKYIH